MISQYYKNYENESTILKICCKAAPATPECPIDSAKKDYLSYREKPLTNGQAKELASWIDNAYQGLRFQKSAKFIAMIMASAKKTLKILPVSEEINSENTAAEEVLEHVLELTEAPIRDRTMYILSTDKKMVLCIVKCVSIGMLSGPPTKRKFVWSDFLARETGSALRSLKATISPSEADLAKPFLNPEVLLVETIDYDMFVGLFRKKLRYEHIVNIQIGSDVSEFLAFNETDITWVIQKIGDIVGQGHSHQLTDFANKQINFIETGQHFQAEGAVRLETDQLFDTSCCPVCKKTENLKQCGRCKKVQYCGTVCQREHWSSHKTSCTSFQ